MIRSFKLLIVSTSSFLFLFIASCSTGDEGDGELSPIRFYNLPQINSNRENSYDFDGACIGDRLRAYPKTPLALNEIIANTK